MSRVSIASARTVNGSVVKSSKRSKSSYRKLGYLSIAVMAASPMARALPTNSDWTGLNSDGLWSSSTLNWDNGIPTTGYQAQFNSAGNGFTNISLGGGTQAINTILFSGTNGTLASYNLGGTNDTFILDTLGAITVAPNVATTTSQTITANIQGLGNFTIANYYASTMTGVAGLTLAGNIAIPTGGTMTLTVTNGALTTISGAITGQGNLTPAGFGTLRFTGQSTYSGTSLFSTNANTIIQVGSSSVMSGTSIVSGPFGTGIFEPNAGGTGNAFIQAIGGDQTIANPVVMNAGGMTIQNAPITGINADPLGGIHSLTFSGPLSFAGTAGRTISINNVGTNAVYLGASATSASTFTLPNALTSNTSIATEGGSTVYLNDVIQNASATAVASLTFTDSFASNSGGLIIFNGANTYSGSTTISSGSAGSQAVFEFAVSSVTSGTSIVSGPFGLGTVLFNTNTNTPTILEPINSDQVIANPLTIAQGFFAADAGTNLRSLTLSGPMNMTAAKTVTDNINAPSTETWGLAGTNASTLTLTGGQITLQSQKGSTLVINDYISGSTGRIWAQNSLFLYLNNGTNSYSAGNEVINLATIDVSADGALGASSGTVGISGGRLLSSGTFTSPRTIYLTGAGTNVNTIDATGTNVLTLTGSITGVGDLTKGTNSGTLQLAQAAGYSTSGNVNVNGGTLLVGPTGGETGAFSVGNTLTINDGATVSVAAGVPSNSVTNSAATLTINGGGQLNLANSALLTTTSSSTIRQYLINGYNGGAWNGTAGINSVNAAADYTANSNSATRALGYSTGTTFATLGLSAGQTLVKFTIYGDANLDGTVDITDLNTVLSNFLSGNPGTWDTGDFNYDGATDISDLNVVLSNYLSSAPSTVRTGVAKASASPASTAKTLTGTVSPADTTTPPAQGLLELVVNTTSGDVELEGNNADIASLQITSNTGGIITANWTDLKANGYANWTDTAKKKTGIGEFDNQFTVSGDYAVLGVVDYGDIYNTSANAEDYVFKYGSVESNDTTVDTDVGSVIYVSGVPEPTTLGLMGLAAAGLMGRRRKQRSR